MKTKLKELLKLLLGLLNWLKAVVETYNALKVVGPKEKQVEEAEKKLKAAENELKEKKEKLQEVLDKV